MKKPLVPWTCGSVCRNSGRVRMAELRPLLDRLDREPGGVDHRLGLVGVDRADGVDDRAAGPHALGGGAQQLELELGQRLRAPAQVGPRREHAEPRARRVDERAVEAGQLGRQRAPVGAGRPDVRRAEPAHVLLELARARLVHLDRDHLAGEHRRLAARRGAEVEHALARLRADARAPRAASRGSAARSRPRRAPSRRRGRRAQAPGMSVAEPSGVWPRTSLTTTGGGSFWARISASASSSPRSRPPDLPDPVRVRVLERALREAREQRRRSRRRPGAGRRS